MLDYKPETERMLKETAERLAQYIAQSAFEFWERKDFRLYVKFHTLNQTEQDRMFNELEVSVLGLFILTLDDGMKNPDEAKKIMIGTIQKGLVSSFLSILKDTGIEEKYVKVWEELIAMRLKEYRRDLKLARKTSASWKELGDDEQMRGAWSRVETITIDCLTHIRRGDVKEGDPLWKLLRKWLITLHATIDQISSLGEEPRKPQN